MARATVNSNAARLLLLHGLKLAAAHAPKAKAFRASTDGMETILSLGFVQLDSINIVERAHHHILWTRLPHYRPPMLDALQREGQVFEQWTHDASIIPTPFFPHWRHRFESRGMNSWVRQKLGRNAKKILAHVHDRIRAEGPLMSKDFEHHDPARKSGGWWDWKPARAALEHLWRTGELSIRSRVNFHKVYDLTSRVLPEAHGLPTPSLDEHIDWACRSALERLGVGTPREIAQFWNAIDAKAAERWCGQSARNGNLERVSIEPHPDQRSGGKPRESFALLDWRERAAASQEALAAAPASLRILSPFDPLIRDRARCRRLFNFDYTFEAFVPEKKRVFGYYVLPLLLDDRLVGRINPRLDRKRSRLIVEGIWWERKPTTALRRQLEAALEEYALFQGASEVEIIDRT